MAFGVRCCDGCVGSCVVGVGDDGEWVCVVGRRIDG